MESMGCATFALLFAMLDIGVVTVRVVGLVALSGSAGLASSLILVSMSAPMILPLLSKTAKLVKRRRRKSGGSGEVESGIMVEETQK